MLLGLLAACSPEVPGAPDAGQAGLSTDGGAGLGGGAVDAGPPAACAFATPAPADADRDVLVSHPFGAEAGTPGHDVRRMRLDAAGNLVDTGARLDVGVKAERIVFVPSGAFAVVLSEESELVSVRMDDGAMHVVDTITLPEAAATDVRLGPDGQTFFVHGYSVPGAVGVWRVEIACDGTLHASDGPVYPLRLLSQFALVPTGGAPLAGGGHAVVIGGEVSCAGGACEPNDARDVRVLGAPWETPVAEVSAQDLLSDSVGPGRMDISPDGHWAAFGNDSLISELAGDVTVLDLSGETPSVAGVFPGFPAASTVRFAPDGETLLIMQYEAGRVATLAHAGGSWSPGPVLTGVGLADQIALVTRGQARGRALVPSVDPSGPPNITVLTVDDVGVRSLGALPLGSGATNIPKAIAIVP